MNKTVTLSLAALTLSGTLATTAMADDEAVNREEIDRLLASTVRVAVYAAPELAHDGLV